MHEFPNLLWCVGPQGNVWSSFYEMAEQVCDFATKMLGLMIREDIASFEVKEEAEKNWADFCKRYIGNTPYRGNCISVSALQLEASRKRALTDASLLSLLSYLLLSPN